MITLTLSDNTQITNLVENGNCYISNDLTLTESTFENKLSLITITDGSKTETYHDMVLRRLWQDNNKTWIAMTEKTHDEILQDTIDTLVINALGG